MTDRIIVGAGGFGRELGELIQTRTNLTLLGYLDDDPGAAERNDLSAPYLGPITADTHRDVPCVVGVGYPRPKQAVVAALDDVGRPLAPPLVHAHAELGRDVRMEDGVIVTAGVVATTNVALGRCVSLHPGALLGHDVTCQDLVAVMPGAAISGNVVLETGVFVGTNAAILQGVTVGAWAIVGAGAVVTRNVVAGATVVGVPARPVS